MQKTSGKPFLKWKLETGLKSDTKRVRHGSRFTEQRPKLSKVRKQQFPQNTIYADTQTYAQRQ